MTVQLKVKGYINGNERGATELQLLDVCDLLEAAVIESGSTYSSCDYTYVRSENVRICACNILNEYPVEYYNKYQSEGILYTKNGVDNCLLYNRHPGLEERYLVYYNSTNNTWNQATVSERY